VSIVAKLAEKPWIAESTVDDVYTGSSEENNSPQKIALRFFLGMVSVFFFLFIITFLSRSQYSDFQALAGEPWQPFTQTSQLWANTLILLVGSLSLHVAALFARRSQLNNCILATSVALLFSFLFVLAQLYVWKTLAGLGYYVASNPANSFYYLFTAVHGIHLLGGLVVLIGVMWRLWQGAPLVEIGKSLELCRTYWDYLFVVWLVLFALLTSSSETFNSIAALCGF